MNVEENKEKPTESTAVEVHPNARILSLDQFRGYAVAGMVLVNFLGNYNCTPRVLRHTNDYCSYADTIMPNFLFAVGFSIAIVWAKALTTEAKKRNVQVKSLDAQARQMVAKPLQFKLARRSLALMIFALILYFPWGQSDLSLRIGTLDFWFTIAKRDWFQTLTHIAWTTLWILPTLSWNWRNKLLWIACGTFLHAALSEGCYFHWVHENPSGIDGGPLGFLTWALPAFAGLWAGERFLNHRNQVNSNDPKNLSETLWYARWLFIACSWMLSGWLLSCLSRSYDVQTPQHDPKVARTSNAPERLADSPVVRGVQSFASAKHRGWIEPPFVPPPRWQERSWNYWMMSQKAGTLTYLVFAAGFSLALFVLWDWLVVRYSIEIPLLRSFGKNALFCYAVHGFLIELVGIWVARDASPWLVTFTLFCLFAILFALARTLEQRRIFIRL